MKVKKNFPGTTIFSIATIIMSVYLYTLFVAFFDSVEINKIIPISNPVISVSSVVSVFAVVILAVVAFLCYFLFSKVRKKSFLSYLFSVIYFSFILFSLVYFSSFIIAYFEAVSSGSIDIYTIVPFINRISMMSEGFDGSFVTVLYELSISFLLKVFGTNVYVPFAFNIVLTILSIILISLSIKFLWGFIISSMSFSIMLVFSTMYNCFDDLTGLSVWMFMVSVYFFVLSFIFEGIVKKKKSLGIILMFVFAAIGFVAKEFLYTPYTISTGIGHISVWDMGIFANIPMLILTALAFCGILSYIDANEDSLLFAECMFIVTYVLAVLNKSNSNYSLLLITILSYFAGELFNVYAHSFVMKEVKEDPVDTVIRQIELSESASEEEVFDDEIKPIVEIVNDSSKDLTAENVDENDTPIFIPTPLSMPKKHTPRGLEFPFSVKESDMKFDIDIKDGDDFDI